MKTIAALVLGGAAMLGLQQGVGVRTSGSDAAGTYENLASAIIAIRDTENSLVHGILMNYAHAALENMAAAASTSGAEQERHLEAAATQITNIASEGDKSIQAVRQRLLQAGHHHHHHADDETQEDYIFIDTKEKQALLAFAQRVSRLEDAGAIGDAARELEGMMRRVLADED